MEVPRSNARLVLLICLFLILLVLLQILFIQRNLLLNSAQMAMATGCFDRHSAESGGNVTEGWDSKKEAMIEEKEGSIVFRYDTDYRNRKPASNDDLTIKQLKHRSSKKKGLQQHLPSSLIIGVRKGGTRALLDALNLHPEVSAANREIHFFDREDNYKLGSEWYRRQMPYAGGRQVVIEKTPAYFISPLVPKRVYELNPGMKLILIVRDPVVRLVSDFTQVFFTKLERNKTQVAFGDAVFKANSSRLNRHYKPVRNSLYAEHLSNWLKYFPLDQLLVLDGDSFIRDPLKQLRLTERFLGLESKIRADQMVYNQRKGFYCFRKEHRRVARCLGETKGRVHVPVDPSLLEILAGELAPHNRRFFAQINRTFAMWMD